MKKFKERFEQGIDHLEGSFKGWKIENPTYFIKIRKLI
jgi:hypothetical protein